MSPSRVFGALALALMLCVGAGRASAAPQFPPLTGRVVDDAHILSADTVQKLDGELASLEGQSGRQLVVATVPSLQGYEIEDYGYQLGRAWGIGQKGQNNGAIFLIAPAERKVRIEVGYGLEPVLTDALSNVILQQKVLPQFRAGRMEQGVVDGTAAIVQQLALPDDQAKAKVAQAAQAPQAQRSGGFPFGGIIPLLVFLFIFARIFGGRGGGMWWLLPFFLSGGGRRDGWGGGGDGGGGGFSGGGGSFGGGGSSGSW